MDFQLPPEMEPFREVLHSSRQKYVRVNAGPQKDTAPWVSKIGGTPYFPKNAQWPVADNGNLLFFLAQLNFREIPPLDGFPSAGILQFFILDDDLYGMNFDAGEEQGPFRILFYPEVDQNPANQQKLPDLPAEYDLLPHHPGRSFPLHFTASEEVVSVHDYNFWKYFQQDFFFQQFGENAWEVMEEFGKKVRPQGHKIGGYAYFTQDDPRRPEDPMLLLFQIDSDEGMDLMWGDMGVGHFFIRQSDLEKRDFSKVLYDWDGF